MNLKGNIKLKASQDEIWEALNNPDVLRQCTPGCKQMTQTAKDSYDLVMEVGIAAVKGRFTGKIQICDKVPGSQYRLVMEGSGNTGFLNAEGLVQLQGLGEETLIEYSGTAQVGGLIAGVGQRIIGGVAKQLVGQFFKCFERAVLQSRKGNGEGTAAREDAS